MDSALAVSSSEIAATVFFTLAIAHTFFVKFFLHLAASQPKDSVLEKVFHLLGEVELVFAFWAIIYLIFLSFHSGLAISSTYLTSRNFTEPAFVFVIMTVCASQPILLCANFLIERVSRLIPFRKSLSFFISSLIIGPLLGSFITEPAAMTVTALILLEHFYRKNISTPLKYATLGLLFVNISIGGTLTPYAAPPILMVARQWTWDLNFMLVNFGWKALIAVVLSTLLASYNFREELALLPWTGADKTGTDVNFQPTPLWVYFAHLFLLALVVISAHQPLYFAILFLVFVGLQKMTATYQKNLQWKSGLLVGIFLAGLIVLGGPQKWWLQPLLSHLESSALYLGAITLTALTDNAALTYLGSQVSGLSDFSKYALVAGSVVGGGLTVIANAPNPAGFGILNSSFGKDGISPGQLFIYALPPTLIAALCFWFL